MNLSKRSGDKELFSGTKVKVNYLFINEFGEKYKKIYLYY